MGLIKAIAGAVQSELADQWQDAFEPLDMGEGVVFVKAGKLRRGEGRHSNTKGTPDIITQGSRIHVYDRQAMLLTDGGRITDFTAEPGMYVVEQGGAPTIFTGDLSGTLMDTWERFRFGGGTPQKQQAFYVNLQEIKGIRFGTPNALNYFDAFYNAELFLRCHGTFSIRVVDPILFYQEVIPRDATHVHIDDVKTQYMSEFLEALQTSINQMSVDGIRISQVASKMQELSAHMRDALDEEWLRGRGMEIVSVGIASVSYDEESRRLIDMRNQGAMLSDPSVREGYVQGAVARGMEAAGSNEAGAGLAFMGMGMGMQAGGGFMGAASQSNQQQMAQQQAWQQQQWAQSQGGVPPQNWNPQHQWTQPQGGVPPQNWNPQHQWTQPQGGVPPQNWNPQQQWTQPQGGVPPQNWNPQQQWTQPQGGVPPQNWNPQAPQAPREATPSSAPLEVPPTGGDAPSVPSSPTEEPVQATEDKS